MEDAMVEKRDIVEQTPKRKNGNKKKGGILKVSAWKNQVLPRSLLQAADSKEERKPNARRP